ncbi:MAG: thioredoxin domain-containing protein [Gemmatimonadota bacterium]|nr:thioredoxin domain-containing protein [Gemmatimonadota bacterium]
MRRGRGTRGGWWTAVVGVVGLAAAGCASEAESASQEQSVVPADVQVAAERADRARQKGSEDAIIQIVEISDFQCPYCGQFYSETYGQIDSAYIESGRVRYLWVGYANPGHGRAWPSIAASFCAGAVGKFWPMHDVLFEKQAEWSASPDPYVDFVGYAEEMNIDGESFGACMRNSTLAPLMLRDYTSVMRAGISSTPYFILADSVAIRGAADFGTFQSALDTLLAIRGAGASQTAPAEAPPANDGSP